MLSDGKDFIMSIVVHMGYCIEVVGEEGQGECQPKQTSYTAGECLLTWCAGLWAMAQACH